MNDTTPCSTEKCEPADELERRQADVCAVARGRLWSLLWWWLASNQLFLWFLCFGACAGSDAGLFALAGVLWLGSTAAAGAAAWIAFSNWSVLPRRWIVLGLAPWGVLIAEVTLLALAFV